VGMLQRVFVVFMDMRVSFRVQVVWIQVWRVRARGAEVQMQVGVEQRGEVVRAVERHVAC
jgi:hypothetical protein